MATRYLPINPRFPHLLHGGDYNPDQWLAYPEVQEEDFRLMAQAGINSVSVGIFSWTSYEPEEGRFTFDWLDRVMDKCAQQGIAAVLATPSGAKPNWMARKYPEIRRVQANGLRDPQTSRHNHCYTSPVYREKVAIMNRKLAERYRGHPALAAWHLSNEYGGECRCDLCQQAFRQWLQRKYGTLDALNAAWWTAFWSHTFTNWDEIGHIDESINGMALDWKRFVTDQTVDFMCHEMVPLRELTPEVPITTNMMGVYEGIDYWKMAPHLDMVSWDNYPPLHDRADTAGVASWVSMVHDLNRALKGGRPFMLMESSPSATNWMQINKLLRPGVHRLKSLQAVAHGADTVQYFQFRKGRGGCEKYHGAVVDHVGAMETRVFKEVAQVGRDLQRLDGVVGCTTPAQVGLIFDWENRWALKGAQGPSPAARQYEMWCHAHYAPLWARGVAVDVINEDCDFSGYRLLIAPALYMVRPGVAERIKTFVAQGGTFVATYLTGIVNENDLVFTGGWPGPLRDVLGVWAEEIDYLYDDESNSLVLEQDNGLGLSGTYGVRQVCDLIHAESAGVLATYGNDFYAGRPALTANGYGSGTAYYLAARADEAFMDAFYGGLVASLGLPRALPGDLPQGVTAQVRTDGERNFIFLMNFAREAAEVALGEGTYTNVLDGGTVQGSLKLEKDGLAVLEQCR